MINKLSRFEKDFHIAQNRFPKLNYRWDKKNRQWVIAGQLDICDTKGVYWDTFDIRIFVPQSYPFCVPILIERSKIIPRDIDWHISQGGVCCYDIEHNLIAMSKRGINLVDFIATKIYPYFANQLYKKAEKKYAGSEYAHYLSGVIQYYCEEHHLQNEKSIINLLQCILDKSGITRNDKCPCGSGMKTKHCHQSSIDTIKSLGYTKIKADLNEIISFYTKKNNN